MPSGRPPCRSSPPPKPHGHARVAEMNRQVAGNLDKIITALEDDQSRGQGSSRRCVLTRPPIAAARRHELTRAKADPGPARARPGRRSRDIRRRRAGGRGLPVLALHPARHQRPDPAAAHQDSRAGSARPSPRASGPPTRRCAPGSPPPSTATSSSPTRTPGSAASSPAHSATSGRHGPDQVTIQTSETPGSGCERPVGDTVHDGTPQVTAPADAKARDNVSYIRSMHSISSVT